jgi:hypothetical protein
MKDEGTKINFNTNSVLKVILSAAGIVLAASAIGVWNEAVNMRDTLRDLTVSQGYLKIVVDKMQDEMATKNEVSIELNELRKNVDTDNKLVQKGTKGAEMIKP